MAETIPKRSILDWLNETAVEYRALKISNLTVIISFLAVCSVGFLAYGLGSLLPLSSLALAYKAISKWILAAMA